MKIAKTENKILSAFMTFALAIVLMAGFPAVKAYAAAGSVYTCTINRCYAHPVTGVIEDSGGQSSYATGQGMVEGCVYANGILEVTDSGQYYLTIRLSLMDYTSNHSFQVQNVGDSGWTTPSEVGVTQKGSDSNGTTNDICMRVPSENCVVRGSMYVEPMGRNVIFYLYPSNYSEGNNTDMKATMVTESVNADAKGSGDNSAATQGAASSDQVADGSSASAQSSLQSSAKSDNKSSSNSSGQSSKSANSSSKKSDKSSSSASSGKKLQSSITATAAPAEESTLADANGSTLNSAEGLSLSTAKNTANATGTDTGTASTGNQIFQIALAVSVTGLILIGAAAGVVYFFRKNWRRWGGAEDDDE